MSIKNRNCFLQTIYLFLVICLIALVLFPSIAIPHGTIISPESRIYKCRFLGNPENHIDPACRAAIALAGTQPIYDWNSLRQANANSRHQEIIPDGQLCSGGNSTFRGMDLVRTDWRTTPIAPDANGQFEFIYYATAPHATKDMILYITNGNWQTGQPIKWSDMEEFCRFGNVPLVQDGNNRNVYRMTCTLPARTGQHVIYNIWQRSDSPEAFYSCSDVVFSGSNPGSSGGGSGGSSGGGAGTTNGQQTCVPIINTAGNIVFICF